MRACIVLGAVLALAGCGGPVPDAMPDAGQTGDAAPPDAPGAHAPIAVDDAVEARPGVAVEIDVLANDSDPDGDPLEVIAASSGAQGTVTSSATGVTYTATVGSTGADELTYVVGDGRGGLDTGTVRVTLLDGPNAPPSAIADAAHTSAGVPVTIAVLANDVDPDGDPLSVARVDDPAGGTASTDGAEVTYTPDPGFTGSDTFEHEIQDPSGEPAIATITVTVHAGPDAVDDAVITTPDASVRIAVLENDLHPEALPLVLASTSTSAHGTATIDAGEIVYAPEAGFRGADAFTYTISDPYGGTDLATVSVAVASAVPSGLLSAAGSRTLAIRDDGALVGWGAGGTGVPTAIGTATEWARVEAGSSHACAIDSAGALSCWGDGNDGKLGLGPDLSDRALPTPVGTDIGWTDVSAGLYHTCGVRAGALFCWGEGDNGKLGLGDVVSRDVPTQVGTETDWTAVAAGSAHSCGIRAGQLWCWGWNGSSSTLGDPALPTYTPQPTPVRIGTDSDWAVVRAGDGHTCGLRLDGSLWCWGRVPGSGGATSPTRVGTSTGWTALDAGERSTCGVDAGALHCWGENTWGQLGDGTQITRAAPTRVGSTSDWSEVAIGRMHACAMRAGGEVSCWGARASGQIGDGVTLGSRVPTRVGARTDWESVMSGGADYTCATTTDRALWCWGVTPWFGGGTAPIPHAEPTQLGAMLGWSVLPHGGPDHLCAMRDDGGLWCWGSGVYGRLGVGSLSSFELPQPVGGTTAFADVAPGDVHTCAVTGAGRLQCWGYNNRGTLGVTGVSQSWVPIEVGTDTTWSDVGSGYWGSCATRTDGTMWCWGSSMGDVPTRFGTATDWREVDAQRGQACAITTAGALHCGTMPGTTLTRVGLDSDWANVSISGAVHTCGVRTGGSLWCFGDNDEGQLGDGTTTNRALPVRVGLALDWSDVAAGGTTSSGHTCAIKTDGTLWCWGDDATGQLGLGLAFALTPVAITL